MELLRTFIAIDLNDAVRRALADIQAKMKPAAADVRWVVPENAHVTLKFLGDTSTAQVDQVRDSLAAIADKTAPFTTRFEGLGVFPNMSRPRVLWIGITEGAVRLEQLARSVDEAVAPLGFAAERRPYSSHLTLGRFRSPRNWDAMRALLEAEKGIVAGEIVAEAIHHIQSTLRPTGPIYKKLFTAPLGGVL